MRADLLERNWWAVLIRGLVAIAFALIAWTRPGLTLMLLLLLFAAYVIGDGILALVSAVRAARREERWWPMVIEGLASIALGLFPLLLPMKAASVAYLIIAIWAFVTGFLELIAGSRLRREIHGEWLMTLSGIVRLAFGVLLVLRPGTGVLTLLWITAGYAFIDGVILVGLALRLRLHARTQHAGRGGMTPQPV
jgi:uncharacterized membrane protein HdeD (DUF308 family)